MSCDRGPNRTKDMFGTHKSNNYFYGTSFLLFGT
jgi:hypothetical protein